MFKIFLVSGTSMKPTLVPGDLVIATSLFKKFIKKKSLIIIFDKNYSYIIKRVFKKNKNHLFLKSDNKNIDSFFSKEPVNINEKLYSVVFKIKMRKIKKLFKLS